ncbi:hypothetical protein H6P81_001978 [Aristolochia fimbriata]|uniref:Uncharacterized protein n=1 Tax=Aristolochia fimbriata TaxID=158543 RepID=A0AAV7F8E4_ARIFI|nr:hypothetical protein H6P81_001978 [Aristolochia fimbriata]
MLDVGISTMKNSHIGEMRNQSFHGSWNLTILRLALALLGVSFVGYTWHSNTRVPCPLCLCDCSSESLLSVLSDCGSEDPRMKEEMEKSASDLLTEELKLREGVMEDLEQQMQASVLDAKKIASQYQKEAEKCSNGVGACEEARERLEAALSAEVQVSMIWEQRARMHGWTDDSS